MGEINSASFRDPSGLVYRKNGKLLRQINHPYQEDYDFLFSSGLYNKLINKNYLIPHTEVEDIPLVPDSAYKVIQPEIIEYITFPYEWSFSQLKDAALLTLAIQNQALKTGMSLKDASAYNIQFHHGKPILIDTTSFVQYQEGTPWVAYRQFCQHFLAPLALMSEVDVRLQELLITNIDGIPLDLCSSLLPFRTRLNFGLLSHIHLHARAETHYDATKDEDNEGNKSARLTKTGFIGLINNLEKTIKNLDFKPKGQRWATYYESTNYSEDAASSKAKITLNWVESLTPNLVLDLGANTGRFSRLVADSMKCLVVSADIDPEAVEINYNLAKDANETKLLPIVLDMVNPTPAVGWDNRERPSFFDRTKADVVLALALIHHLAITNHVPFSMLAKTFASLGNNLILEFVPKEDSQVRRMLRTRDDIFGDYNLDELISAFKPFFKLVEKTPVHDSKRTLLLFERVG